MAGSFIPGLETCEDRRLLSGLATLLPVPLAPVTGLVRTVETVAAPVVQVVDQSPLGQGLSSVAGLIEETGGLLNSLAPSLSSVVSRVILPTLSPLSSELSHDLETATRVSLHSSERAEDTEASHLAKEVRVELKPSVHERSSTSAKASLEKERTKDDEEAEPKTVSENDVREAVKSRRHAWFKEPSDEREEAEVSKIDLEEGKEKEGGDGGRDKLDEESPLARSHGELSLECDAVIVGTGTETAATVAEPAPAALQALDREAIFSEADGLMSSFVPFDPAQLEEGIARLLDQLGRLRGEVGDWLSGAGALAPWLTAAAAGLAAAEIARRRRQATATEAHPYLASTVPLP